MTTEGAPQLPVDISAFMNSPMPAPTEGARQDAMSVPDMPHLPSPETLLHQPTVQEPRVQEPKVQQPQVQQPEIEQPVDDVQQRLAAMEAQLQQYQSRESAYEEQRREIETQRRNAELQQAQAGARQYALQQYQKYIGAGNTEEQARQWAQNDAMMVYQAYTYQMQAQQTMQQQEAIARRYGISPQDIPSDIPPQAMERFAAMQAQLNRTSQQVQTTNRNQVQQQRFDSNVGATAPNDPVQQLLGNLGNTNQVADPRLLSAWNQWMKQQNPYL